MLYNESPFKIDWQANDFSISSSINNNIARVPGHSRYLAKITIAYCFAAVSSDLS